MILSPYVDTTVSVLFILFILSLVASFINETWVARFNYRGRFLRKMLNEVLSDPINRDFTDALYKHPLISALYEKKKRLPVYIPTRFFSRALVETIAGQLDNQKITFEQNKDTLDVSPVSRDSPEGLFDKYGESVKSLRYSPLKVLLHSFLVNAANKSELLNEAEAWFDAYMTQGSYWYKAKMQVRLFIISIFIAIFTHFDIIVTTQTIFQDDILREGLKNTAVLFAKENSDMPKADVETIKGLMEDVKDIELPIGWDTQDFKLRNILGWAVAGILISFGAPFWFDLLGKMVNVRKISSSPSK
jgi:hypothetical protein